MTAHEEDAFRGAMLKSVVGIVFLGTPHQGSNCANLAMAIGGMLNANPLATRSTSAVVKAGDLKLLTYNSGPLQDLILSARHRLQNLMVVSFYETEPTPPLNSLVSGCPLLCFRTVNPSPHSLHYGPSAPLQCVRKGSM